MQYITSRGFYLPESPRQMANSLWFNMWRVKLWPYAELLPGDVLYWYQSPSKKIVWKTRVNAVERFAYADKTEAARRIVERFDNFDEHDGYYLDAPTRGFCLAYKVTPLERANLFKPDHLRFPHQGWLRVDSEVAQEWLLSEPEGDETTLDDVAGDAPLLERLYALGQATAEINPERVRAVVTHTIRRDTQLIQTLKQVCDFRCQFPGCNVRIPKREGGFYIEVAHIEPVSKGGKSVLGNLLVLCPNHHKELDYGDLQITEQSVQSISGKLNGKPFEIRLPGAE